jgi:DNA-binding transcriptional regulator YhcF (GntR family)
MSEPQKIVPKYLEIAGQVREQILRGDLQAGDEIPSERELAASWNVARGTAARALAWLRSEGLVEARQGAGTHVRTDARPGVPDEVGMVETTWDANSWAGPIELAYSVAAGGDVILSLPRHCFMGTATDGSGRTDVAIPLALVRWLSTQSALTQPIED